MTAKRNDHLSLICDIGELANLMSDRTDLPTFLQQVVRLVAANLNAGVGSIYLYDEAADELVLTATIGLNPQAVGKIRMKTNEGLVGHTIAQMAPICEGNVAENPRFKYFKSAREDRFNSFLAVPISLGSEKIGVLVVQHELRDYFNSNDVMALRAIASQLAGTVANARLMMSGHREPQITDREALLAGLRIVRAEATVPGYALAPSAILHPLDSLAQAGTDEVYQDSLNAFRQAIQKTAGQLKILQDQLVQRLPESTALIFEAHHMILKDPRFEKQIGTLIRQGVSAPAATRQVAHQFIELFQKNANPYIREKSQDVEDLARRLLFNLKKEQSTDQGPLAGRIVIAADLYPSDLLKLASEGVAGMIFVGGAVTSHVAIIARSLKIPMTITHQTDLLAVPEGTSILMDADVGTIYVNPSDGIIKQFRSRNQARQDLENKGGQMRAATRTRDGKRITLMANINLLGELALAKDLKAEGVGLYRSEFPFIVRSDFPSEEEQRHVYERLFQAMGGKAVYVRTLDVGGDKILPYLNIPKEENPALGLRSIRFSLHYRHIFDQQIRAILRAGSTHEHLGIIFPMISSIEEFETARQAVYESLFALEKEGLDHHRRPRIGVMVETPALVPIMEELARRVDFFSIGTNDFIQYLLAVDRTNKNVAAYYQPFHPAVLRSLAEVVRQARQHRKSVCVCGEVAHQPDFIPFLIGIGVRQLSVDPQFLPDVQKQIGTIDVAQAQAKAQLLLSKSTLAG
jgi:phosphotransferase system enzyme I (PtsP)